MWSDEEIKRLLKQVGHDHDFRTEISLNASTVSALSEFMSAFQIAYTDDAIYQLIEMWKHHQGKYP
jgi:hypothetical protein